MSENNQMPNIITRAFRPSRKSDIQYLLASELAAATLAKDPLQKIRHVLEAFLALGEEEQKQICTQEEIDLYNMIYEACLSLIGARELNEDNTFYCIIPWVNQDPRYCSFIYGSMPQEKSLQLIQQGRQGLLDPAQASLIKSRFVTKAMPLIVRLMGKIMQSFITIEVWEKALAGVGRKRAGAEEAIED